MPKHDKKARRHAKRAKKMQADAARRSGPVKISYLPGFEPPPKPPEPAPEPAPEPFVPRTKYPFTATINGREAYVSRNAYGIQIDYPDE